MAGGRSLGAVSLTAVPPFSLPLQLLEFGHTLPASLTSSPPALLPISIIVLSRLWASSCIETQNALRGKWYKDWSLCQWKPRLNFVNFQDPLPHSVKALAVVGPSRLLSWKDFSLLQESQKSRTLRGHFHSVH